MKYVLALCCLVSAFSLQAQHNWSIRASGDVGGNVYISPKALPMLEVKTTLSGNYAMELENHRSKKWSLIYGLSFFNMQEKPKDTIRFITPEPNESGWGTFTYNTRFITTSFGVRYIFIQNNNHAFYGTLRQGVATYFGFRQHLEGEIEGKKHSIKTSGWIWDQPFTINQLLLYSQLSLGYQTKLSKGASPRGFYLSAETRLHIFNDLTSQGYFSTTALFLHGGLGLSYRF